MSNNNNSAQTPFLMFSAVRNNHRREYADTEVSQRKISFNKTLVHSWHSFGSNK